MMLSRPVSGKVTTTKVNVSIKNMNRRAPLSRNK